MRAKAREVLQPRKRFCVNQHSVDAGIICEVGIDGRAEPSEVLLAQRLGILFVATALGCTSTAKQEGTGEYVDDAVIATKVKAAILNEATLKSAEINVETCLTDVRRASSRL